MPQVYRCDINDKRYSKAHSQTGGGREDGHPRLGSYREIHLIYESEVQIQANHKVLLIHPAFDNYFSIWRLLLQRCPFLPIDQKLGA